MTATATRMQLLAPPATHLPAPKPNKKPARTAIIRDTLAPRELFEPVISAGFLPAVGITETANYLTVVVPLRGLDARKVHVMAMPRSLLIEIRVTNTLCYVGHKELQQQRVTRELIFSDSIVKGSSAVRLFGSDLEITCLKAHKTDDDTWSELVQLDTRNSLGCVRSSDLSHRLHASLCI